MRLFIVTLFIIAITAVASLAQGKELYPSRDLIEHIKKTEGFRACAYKDFKANAIGYGTQNWDDGTPVKLTNKKGKKICITEEKATELLMHFVYFKAGQVDAWSKATKVKLNQNEFDAIVGFVYNLGYGTFRRSSIASNLKLKNKQAAAEAFLAYNKAGKEKQELKGLTLRRQYEKALFLTKPKKVKNP
jgi:lysozyme